MFGEVDFKPDSAYSSVPMEEQMDALRRAVAAGKVRHIGLSNETAWGLTKFCHLGSSQTTYDNLSAQPVPFCSNAVIHKPRPLVQDLGSYLSVIQACEPLSSLAWHNMSVLLELFAHAAKAVHRQDVHTGLIMCSMNA